MHLLGSSTIRRSFAHPLAAICLPYLCKALAGHHIHLLLQHKQPTPFPTQVLQIKKEEEEKKKREEEEERARMHKEQERVRKDRDREMRLKARQDEEVLSVYASADLHMSVLPSESQSCA